MKRTELRNNEIVHLADEDEKTDLNAVIFEIFVFNERNVYQDTIHFILEDMERTELSYLRRVDKTNGKYFQIYADFIEYLETRNFFKNCTLVLNSTEYYPVIVPPVKEEQ